MKDLPTISYSTWLSTYTLGCILFNVVTLLEFAIVNTLIAKKDLETKEKRKGKDLVI